MVRESDDTDLGSGLPGRFSTHNKRRPGKDAPLSEELRTLYLDVHPQAPFEVVQRVYQMADQFGTMKKCFFKLHGLDCTATVDLTSASRTDLEFGIRITICSNGDFDQHKRQRKLHSSKQKQLLMAELLVDGAAVGKMSKGTFDEKEIKRLTRLLSTVERRCAEYLKTKRAESNVHTIILDIDEEVPMGNVVLLLKATASVNLRKEVEIRIPVRVLLRRYLGRHLSLAARRRKRHRTRRHKQREQRQHK